MSELRTAKIVLYLPDQDIDRFCHVLSLADEHVEDDAVESHPHQAHDGLQGPEVGELVPGSDDHIRGVVVVIVVVIVVDGV